MTQDSSTIAHDITILLVTAFFIFAIIIYVVCQNNKQFEKWFDEILSLAPAYGFTPNEVENFQEILWWDFYISNLTPKQALEEYLKNNPI